MSVYFTSLLTLKYFRSISSCKVVFPEPGKAIGIMTVTNFSNLTGSFLTGSGFALSSPTAKYSSN